MRSDVQLDAHGAAGVELGMQHLVVDGLAVPVHVGVFRPPRRTRLHVEVPPGGIAAGVPVDGEAEVDVGLACAAFAREHVLDDVVVDRVVAGLRVVQVLVRQGVDRGNRGRVADGGDLPGH